MDGCFPTRIYSRRQHLQDNAALGTLHQPPLPSENVDSEAGAAGGPLWRMQFFVVRDGREVSFGI